MKIVQLTPGAGNMYCGNCLRDNALVGALHRLGHDVCMVPLYLPLTLDEEDESRDMPVFFGGASVYLEQKLPFFRFMPRFVHRWLASRTLLRTVGARAASTQPSQVGSMTVSMLQGEKGKQARELDELCRWLRTEQKPEVVVFSNALLLGMHDEIRTETGAKTVCFLSGEDGFLDELSEPFRSESWNLVRKHARNVDLLIAPSRYYAGFMGSKLEIPPEKIRILPPGIRFEGFETPATPCAEPTLGYFARMNFGKGLDVLVDAFLEIRRRSRFSKLKLKIGGGLSPWNEPFVGKLKQKIDKAERTADVEFHPNVDRAKKIEFLNSLTLFSVPSRINEPFGLYVLESQATGVPALFPRKGAFPEIQEDILPGKQDGVLFEPENPVSLADTVENLLADDAKRRDWGRTARSSVFERYHIDSIAKRFVEIIDSIAF